MRLLAALMVVALAQETVESVAKKQEELAGKLGTLSVEIHKLKDQMMDSSLDPIIAKLMDLQKDIQTLTESVKGISNGLSASRKAVGIDYTPAEAFISRLSSLGERMKQLESRLMTFDDKELAQKVDQTLFAQSATGTGLDKSISSIKSQTKGLNEMTKDDDRFTRLYLLCGGVALMFGLIWMTLQKVSVRPLP